MFLPVPCRFSLPTVLHVRTRGKVHIIRLSVRKPLVCSHLEVGSAENRDEKIEEDHRHDD